MVVDSRFVNIKITREVKERLDNAKGKGQTLVGVLEDLLDLYEHALNNTQDDAREKVGAEL